MTICLAGARAEASRRNGAKSRGPKTPDGKARSAQNALKHGFRAQKYMVLPQENAAEFKALEAALMEELGPGPVGERGPNPFPALAPVGALQTVLAQRVVAATWRLARAERLEADLFEEEQLPGRSLGLALIRECNGARAFDTLLRYRGGSLAELWRALRLLKALQAEARQIPDEPEARRKSGEIASTPVSEEPEPSSRPYAAAPAASSLHRSQPADAGAAHEQPFEPEGRRHPGDLNGTTGLPIRSAIEASCRAPRSG
jgi:hypothetical protein